MCNKKEIESIIDDVIGDMPIMEIIKNDFVYEKFLDSFWIELFNKVDNSFFIDKLEAVTLASRRICFYERLRGGKLWTM